jgi:homoserine kinase
MPRSLELISDLRREGIAAVVSGAGPTVLAFVDGSTTSEVLRRTPRGWDALALPVDSSGAKVTGGS